MKIRLMLGFVLLAVLGLVSIAPAQADSFTTNGVLFTGDVTSTTVTVTVTCTVVSCDGFAIGDITLKGFTFTGTATDISAPSGYLVQNGGQDNGGATSCNSTQPQSAVCWNRTGFFPLSTGVTYTFQASIADGTVGGDPLHVQTVIYSDSTGGTRITGVSDDLTGGTSVPEPASVILLGFGLAGVPFLRRRK